MEIASARRGSFANAIANRRSLPHSPAKILIGRGSTWHTEVARAHHTSAFVASDGSADGHGSRALVAALGRLVLTAREIDSELLGLLLKLSDPDTRLWVQRVAML